MYPRTESSHVSWRRFLDQTETSPTWEELQQIEEERRKILKRAELPFWRILLFWKGTCLRVFVRDWLLWVTIGIFVFIRIQARLGALPRVAKSLEDTNIDIIGGFLSFFLVLFVNQSNTRFNEMYKQSCTASGEIYDISARAAIYLPKPQAHRLVRYLNAAHVAGYTGLSTKTYKKQHFFDPLNRSLKLLSDQEMIRINSLDMDEGGECFRELLTWCLMEVRRAQDKGFIEGRYAKDLLKMIESMGGAMDSLYDYSDQPIHFFYIHFLSLLTAFYLPIFAMSTAYGAGIGEEYNWTVDVLSGLILVLQAMFVIGLRLLGQVMIDPYGDDLEDLSVLTYVQETWKDSNRLLATQFPPEIEPEAEKDMRRSQASLGQPWQNSYGGPVSSGGSTGVV